MGIAYYDLDEPVIIKKPNGPPQPIPAPVAPPKLNLFEGETTECNYLVMAFIVGVLLLALSDSARR
jgi:hypothetical protein